MKYSEKHTILAWFFDAFFLGIILNYLNKLLKNEVNSDNQVLVGLTLTALIVSILYHAKWKDKTTFLSVGELLVGGIKINGAKEYYNPFCVNRTVIWVFMFIHFAYISGSSFLPDTEFTSPFFTFILTILFYFGYVDFNQGKPRGLIITSILLLFKIPLLLIIEIPFILGILYAGLLVTTIIINISFYTNTIGHFKKIIENGSMYCPNCLKIKNKQEEGEFVCENCETRFVFNKQGIREYREP